MKKVINTVKNAAIITAWVAGKLFNQIFTKK